MAVSKRIERTETAYIDVVIDQYASGEGNSKPVVMAMGSSHWGPPLEALEDLRPFMADMSVNKYGSITGLPSLKEEWIRQLIKHGYGVDEEEEMSLNRFCEFAELAVTVGAQQAFFSLSLILCDQEDEAVLLAPYYFSHKLALQIAGLSPSNIRVCPFEEETMKTNWKELEKLIARRPKMVVLTSPNNPSGAVYTKDEMLRIVELCRRAETWLVIDETYYEFLYNEAGHYFITQNDYENVCHILSMSKSFGMPGWRVGALTFPLKLSEAFRKIQDTNPTHTCVLSQHLALQCLRHDLKYAFVKSKIEELDSVRNMLWEVLAPLGMKIKPAGSFYFLIPLPKEITEDLAIDILAKQFKVLLLHGWIFGAPGYLRLSYGCLPPETAKAQVENVGAGFKYLYSM
jgi:aspartate/methionine/tyrosine aminotransferase